MSQKHILIHQMSYQTNTESSLFDDLNLTFLPVKTGLVGRNGVGKSMLLKLILNQLKPHSGSIQVTGSMAYLPQDIAGTSEITIADVLGVNTKLLALNRIKAGSVDERDFAVLNDDWDIEDRIQSQLTAFGLHDIPYHRKIKRLSGGELTRLLLAKTFLSAADFLLLDEPTNHLDQSARQQLYAAIKKWNKGLIIVSHDRTLLNCMDEIVELTTRGAARYGGNYDAYASQREIEKSARAADLHDAKKQMQKTQNSIQGAREKHQQKQSYGRDLRKSVSIDKLSANAKQGNSERSQRKMLVKEERMLKQAESLLQSARENIEMTEDIYVDLPMTSVPNGKMILNAASVSFAYEQGKSIINNFSLILQGPERIALAGDNGSGKTTLIKLLLGELEPHTGRITLGTERISYLDQNTSLLKQNLSVLDNYLHHNPDATANDAYNNLARFLFKNTAARKLASQLSGGERLRALLACVLMSRQPPQLLILDEPTNHLDLHSIASIESALKNFCGAMIVISHDIRFLENIAVEKIISFK